MCMNHSIWVCLVHLLKFVRSSSISRFEGLGYSCPLTKRRLCLVSREPVLSSHGKWETLSGQERSSLPVSPVQDPGLGLLPSAPDLGI